MSEQKPEISPEWTNQEIAARLYRIADILEIQGELVFKVVAYRRAADAIEHLGRDLRELWQNDPKNLRAIQGVGEALAEKLDELLRTGEMTYYRKISKGVPAGIFELLTIPDVGPKTVARLWKELKITDVAKLEKAARAGKLRALKGFGARSEEKILAGIEATRCRKSSTRVLLGVAYPFAQEIVAALRAACGDAIRDIAPAGSLRRMRPTIGDLDILVSSDSADKVIAAFVSLSLVSAINTQGTTKASIVAQNGLQVDLRVLEPKHWGSALQYFTGSKEHNIALRQIALDQGLSLSEWGFKTVKSEKDIFTSREEEVYEKLGLQWIPPELREATDELELARQKKLPRLIELKDLKGDLQSHSNWSDGSFTIKQMAEAVRARGLKYLAITDHSQGLGIARGLTTERVKQQWAEIDTLNKKWKDFVVLKSIEMEIRADGSLDFPDDLLAQFDLVTVSTHSALKQTRDKITARVIKAIQNPYVDIYLHPTARLINAREESALDLEEVFRVAKETGTLLEIDGAPERLDLDDVRVRRAREVGVNIVINSDAHSPDGFDGLFYGVAMARRGGLEARDVLNTLEWKELRKKLKRNRK
ncbi:MAG: DNA polymerase/3'-5' exonuclease PolX [Anaerolineales bacterium]|nr:DNA polymerase/3'-5' exonuclease PolX [Anaerolineales bacterium]